MEIVEIVPELWDTLLNIGFKKVRNFQIEDLLQAAQTVSKVGDTCPLTILFIVGFGHSGHDRYLTHRKIFVIHDLPQ